MREKYNLLGQKFGRLNVVEFAGVGNDRKYLWKCMCDCGNKEEIIVKGKDLRSGNTKSCGCYQKQRLRETRKKYNTYDLSDEFGIGYTSKGEEFYFDLEDYDLIKDYCWYKNSYGHIVYKNKETKLCMHRIVLGAEDINYDVDHINRKPFDNRKNNLRICSHGENIYNSSLQKNNKTGVTGVFFNSKNSNWWAYITSEGERKYLGVFNNIEDAIIARLQAEKEYFGEFSPQQHLFKQYSI